MRVVGKEGALKGGGFEGKIIENYVMDGQKDNDVISTAYRCLLLWLFSIVSGAFGQTRIMLIWWKLFMCELGESARGVMLFQNILTTYNVIRETGCNIPGDGVKPLDTG